jgi:hypothetical protein
MTIRRYNVVSFVAACFALFLVVACQFGSMASPSPAASSNPPPAATATGQPDAVTSLAADGGCGTTTYSVEYAPYTTATLAGYGWDFVVADVMAFEPAMFNTADGKAPPGYGIKPVDPNSNVDARIYTPVLVGIVQTLSGPSMDGAQRFLIEGGTVGCYTVRVDVAPRVAVDSRYVFILTDVRDPAGRNTLGLREAKFAWAVDSKETVSTVDGLRSIDELTEIVTRSPASSQP